MPQRIIMYEDYINNEQPNIRNCDPDSLFQRGKYLVEYIDKIPNKLTSESISKLIQTNSSDEKKSRIVASYSPGRGKTTALRQFVIKSLYNPTTGVVSMNRKDDIEKFYYDVISNIEYIMRTNKNSHIDEDYANNKFVVLYTSDHKCTFSELQYSKWIFCTHRRLLIDPEALLYVSKLPELITYNQSPRKYLLIDELPSQMYQAVTYNEMVPIIKVKQNIESYFKYLGEENTDHNRARFIHDSISSKDMLNVKLLDTIPRNGISLLKVLDDKKLSKESKIKAVSIVIERLNYYINYYNKKLDDKNRKISQDHPEWDTNSFEGKHKVVMEMLRSSWDHFNIYYSVLGFSIKNIIIFDGTGDILLRNSGWTLVSDSKRNLPIKEVKKVDALVSRYSSSSEDIVKSFVSSIIEIQSKYSKNKSILVYMWKSKKNKEEKDEIIVDLVNETLRQKGINNVDVVTYNSGKEKATNEYVKSEVVIILGDFFIPRDTMKEFNEANLINEEKPVTPEDYTLALIIQLLYRTKARQCNSGIDLYIDSHYNDSFINRILTSTGNSPKDFSSSLSTTIRGSYSRKKIDYKTNKMAHKLGMDEKDEMLFKLSDLKELMYTSDLSHKTAQIILDDVSDSGLNAEIIKAGGKGKSGKIVKISR